MSQKTRSAPGRRRWWEAWMRAGVLLGVVALTGCQMTQTTQTAEGEPARDLPAAPDPEAQRIIDRPGREVEEAAAWATWEKPLPIEALLDPPTPWRDAYPTREVDTPWRWLSGIWYWMDNRYGLTTMYPPDWAGNPTFNSEIRIVDSLSGRSYRYREGVLECYRPGAIVFRTGRKSGPHPRAGYYLWAGTLARVKEVDAYETVQSGERRPVEIDPRPCSLAPESEQLARHAEDAAIAGTFVDLPGTKILPVWSRAGLRKEHGSFYINLQRDRKLTYAQRDAEPNVHWRTPAGEWKAVGLHSSFELQGHGDRVNDHWVSWLARYVFAGRGITYSEAPWHSSTDYTPGGLAYGKRGNLVIFDPASGEIIRTPRPAALLPLVQVWDAHATRAGLLWQSGPNRPWGLYLSRGEAIRRISERHVNRVNVSPDGCRAAVTYYKSPGQCCETRLEIIDFCAAEK